MKNAKVKTSFLLAFIIGFTGAHAQNGGFTLNGSFNGMAGQVKLLTYKESNRTYTAIDSGAVKDGKFELKGKLVSPEMVTIKFEPGNWTYAFFLDNARVSVTADTTAAKHYDYTRYGMDKGAMLNSVSVSGSKTQDDYMKYKNDPVLLKFDAVFAKMDKKYDSLNAEGKEAMKPEFDSVEVLNDSREMKLIDSSVNADPASVAAIYNYQQYYLLHSKTSIGYLDSILRRFNGDAKNSVYFAYLKNDADERSALLPGNVAPDFTLLKRDSSKFTLSSTRGKYIMVDFWASWCVPCRQAIPHWKEVYAKYHDKGFDIVSVSDDDKRKNWKAAMDAEKMPWTQVDDEFPVKNLPARVGTLYKTTYIPFYVLLDKQGKILAYTDQEQVIDDKLAKLLGNN
jgi:thiol-disulfide isomerase/thioredoxin